MTITTEITVKTYKNGAIVGEKKAFVPTNNPEGFCGVIEVKILKGRLVHSDAFPEIKRESLHIDETGG